MRMRREGVECQLPQRDNAAKGMHSRRLIATDRVTTARRTLDARRAYAFRKLIVPHLLDRIGNSGLTG